MDLSLIREQIDRVDEQMVELFDERMRLSAAVAEAKKAAGLPLLNKTREREILLKVSEQSGEELEMYTRVLFSTLFNLSKSYQMRKNAEHRPLTDRIRAALASTPPLFPAKGVVACQGVEGAYSQIAADKLFAMPDIRYFPSFEGVFKAVESGEAAFGVLPIENSSYGSVNNVYDLMRHHKFHIVRGVKLHINHRLLVKPGQKLEDITEICTHEQAVGQCGAFLAARPQIKVRVCANTALAAQTVAESARTDIAAISSADCAALYGLTALPLAVQNSDNNYTRFICIARELAIYPGANRISLMLTLPHQPGSLYNIISQFAALGLNLSKLESRPIAGRDFEFMFYFDLEASVWSEDVLTLLGEMELANDLFVFLGCYYEI